MNIDEYFLKGENNMEYDNKLDINNNEDKGGLTINTVKELIKSELSNTSSKTTINKDDNKDINKEQKEEIKSGENTNKRINTDKQVKPEIEGKTNNKTTSISSNEKKKVSKDEKKQQIVKKTNGMVDNKNLKPHFPKKKSDTKKAKDSNNQVNYKNKQIKKESKQIGNLKPINYLYKNNGHYSFLSFPSVKDTIGFYGKNGFCVISNCLGKENDYDMVLDMQKRLIQKKYSYMPIYLKEEIPENGDNDTSLKDISFIVFPYWTNKGMITEEQNNKGKKFEGEYLDNFSFISFIYEMKHYYGIKYFLLNTGKEFLLCMDSNYKKMNEMILEESLRYYGRIRNKELDGVLHCFTNPIPLYREELIKRKYINGEICVNDSFNRL